MTTAFDWLIRGGEIIDGAGRQRYRGDLGVSGDRISAIGPLAGATALRVIEANGKIIAPGFVDVHNHSEGWLSKTPNFHSKTSQGFTTEVLMSDGISYAPLSPDTAPHWLYYLRSLDGLRQAEYTGWRSIREYLQRLDGATSQNTIAEIPFANVRSMAVGWGRAPADDAQIRRMQYEIRRGMDEGACGLSTGLDYVSQCFCRTDELVEACLPMRSYGGLYVTHVRYKKGTLNGLREAVEIGKRSGAPVHISHLKGSNERERDELLDYIDRVVINEVDFSFDVYPYLPGSTMLNMLLPYEVWEDGPLGVIAKLAEPTIRRRFAEQLEDYRTPASQVRLGWVPGEPNRKYQGQTLVEFAEAMGKPLADALCDLLIDENLAVLCVFHVGDDRLVESFLRHDKFMLGSDGIFFAEGQIHPRQYGSAPRLLGPLTRERKLFSLEEAVRKASGFPARRFGLRDRGEIRLGAFADLVVFDPTTITDLATYERPHAIAEGIDWVLVNGVPVIEKGNVAPESVAKPPGRALAFEPAR